MGTGVLGTDTPNEAFSTKRMRTDYDRTGKIKGRVIV